ncbi:hypothetical protein CKO31_23620 [Thiohalocapsa halophila]|uniref:Addiction module protein n=1 Tax=Thiohalocapsa halophila TaxID=69359 RepID=A0ABS1CP07_9GAMM|nr:addiction module protein [Thiohalocapsa halophila]MBK1633677.1 hypothetical protein [Thiohalocapsa halophila]
MHAQDVIDEAHALSLEDKLRLVEEIWDSIAEDGRAPPLSDWQQAELDKRERLYRAGAERLHAVDDVHAKLRSRA